MGVEESLRGCLLEGLAGEGGLNSVLCKCLGCLGGGLLGESCSAEDRQLVHDVIANYPPTPWATKQIKCSKNSRNLIFT